MERRTRPAVWSDIAWDQGILQIGHQVLQILRDPEGMSQGHVASLI